jgi:hypothetical protein
VQLRAAARRTAPPVATRASSRARPLLRQVAVLDLIFVVVTIAFFVVSVAYANACDRL